MFGLGFGEVLLLMAIGLIVLGPKQMPQVARVIGRTIAEIKKALGDVTAQVARDLKDEGRKPETPPKPLQAPENTMAQNAPTPDPGEKKEGS